MTDIADDLPQARTPHTLVAEFQARRDRLDQRLLSLERLMADLRLELQGDSQASLNQLLEAAQYMVDGRVYRQIELEAKEGLGALESSLNRTQLNLHQLGFSQNHQGDQVPELAVQLDAITSDMAECTQSLMDRLDSLMGASDDAIRAAQACQEGILRLTGQQATLHTAIAGFLNRAVAGEDQNTLAQEVLECLFGYQVATPALVLDLSPVQEHLQKLGDEAFEILDLLQFQDITRQKIEQLALLLKQLQHGLARLLMIFNIQTETQGAMASSDRRVSSQDRSVDPNPEAHHRRDGLDEGYRPVQEDQPERS